MADEDLVVVQLVLSRRQHRALRRALDVAWSRTRFEPLRALAKTLDRPRQMRDVAQRLTASDSDWVTVSEAAREHGVDAATVRRWAKRWDGQHAKRKGSQWMVDPARVEQQVSERRQR